MNSGNTDYLDATGLDDLCARFIINLPFEELESVERICFQIEEAQWFYEDFIRPLDPGLPSLSLKAFALRIFQHCPLMSQWTSYHRNIAFSEFLAYKTRVPVRGAILLSEDMEEVVLVKGWKKGANWSFPRGKINKDERDIDCAIREVYEETGFDIRAAGLVDEVHVKSIEVTMREQHMRLYVFRGVPHDTYFEPRTRKEISKIEWYKLSELPTLIRKNKQHDQGFAVANANKFYMVAPFMHPLKKWIAQQRKLDTRGQVGLKPIATAEMDGPIMEEASPAVNTGLTHSRTPVEMATTNVPPQVASSEDVSSHLKRLLNIGGATPAKEQYPQPAVVPPQNPMSNQAKSQAILSLLQNGASQKSDSQPQNDGVTPTHVAGTQQSYPLPVPQRGPYLPQDNGIAKEGFPGYTRQETRPPHELPSATYDAPTPGELDTELKGKAHPPSLSLHPRRSAAAPFQQTGDPQFSQQAQYPQAQSPIVPSASALPPPKLSSHSLALLNVFKNQAIQSPKARNSATAPSTAEHTPVTGNNLQHQDYLLGLLRGNPAAPARGPAELPSQPISPNAKKILRRSNGDNAIANRHLSPTFGTPSEDHIPTTPSIPPPKFEKKAKSSPKRNTNGTKHQASGVRQTSDLPSHITILPRPLQSESKNSPSPTTRPPLELQPPYIPELGTSPQPKFFQPQILRRDEKAEPDTYSPAQSNKEPEGQGEPQTTSTHRPSQTSAQKDLLLSLFGKQNNAFPSSQTLTTESNHSLPLSPRQEPHADIPSLGTPSEGGAQRSSPSDVESPANKNFLLSFLQGISK